jgi:hypothetical protein
MAVLEFPGEALWCRFFRSHPILVDVCFIESTLELLVDRLGIRLLK